VSMPPGVMRTTAFCVIVAPRIAGRNNQVVLLEEVRFGSEEANSRRTGIGVMIMRVLCKRITMGVKRNGPSAWYSGDSENR